MDVYVGNGDRRKRVRKSTGCTEEVQARMIEQTMVAVNRGLTTRQRAQNILDNVLPTEERGVAMGDCSAFYDDCIKREDAPITVKELYARRNAIARMTEWMLANTRVKWVNEVTSDVAWMYSCAIGERGVTAKTRNNEVGQLRTVWKMLEKYGKVQDNPWTLARVGRNRSEETHGRAFSDTEIEDILAAAREVGCEWEGVVIVALYTGLRKGDIESLKWEGDPEKEVVVDIESRRIHGTPSKTSHKRIKVNIPMHDRVITVLKSACRENEFVFPWRQSHIKYHRAKSGDVLFGDVLARAGVVAGKGEKVSFHSLRHTFITRLADAGVAEDVRMRLAGHTNAATHGVYTHEDSQSKAAIGALK
jgi:integrase